MTDKTPRAAVAGRPRTMGGEEVMLFRALWPIIDEDVTLDSLISEAREELPALLRRSRCELTGAGSFAVRDSVDTPGSGRITELVLVFTAPAVEKAAEWPPGGRFDDPLQDVEALPDCPEGVDGMVVARLLLGELVPHTKAERHEVIRRWTGRDKELERRFGWNVARDRRQMAAADMTQVGA